MKLRTQLLLALLFLALASVLGVGLSLRASEQEEATRAFDARVERACTEVTKELQREADRDLRLIENACYSGELVDRVALEIESGRIEESRLRFSQLVPSQRSAFALDELVLGTSRGEVLGADPRALLSLPSKELEKDFGGLLPKISLRTLGNKPAAWMSRCRVKSRGTFVGLLGARHIAPQLERIGTALDVRVALQKETLPLEWSQTQCDLRDEAGNRLPLYVGKSNQELKQGLARIDRVVLIAGGISTCIAMLLAVLLARSLGKPIATLALEASKVAKGEAQPLKGRVRGSGEVRDLVLAFDSMIVEIESTKRRLSDATRVAAWREVARRVAHEVKNPLAPIQAAVETLRRLRARNDPAFDEYFDEATRTVLSEVHRIATIVTEFTRFARLPAPKPELLALEALVQDVLTLQRAASPAVSLEIASEPQLPEIRADRGQIIQVITNLVQNACEAVESTAGAQVRIQLQRRTAENISISVIDNGPGIDAAIAAKLFEPYATTKAKGTGLGLAIAQRIALEHEGDLSYVTKRSGERGAEFELVLPIAGPHEHAPDSGPNSGALP
jgi:two-component system, NtrC family, nitrogen regulation sensor histidine kinase NtrY